MNGCHVALIGKATKPGELRYTGNGTAFLRIGLMVQDSKRPEDDPPEFVNVTVWGDLAEQLQDALPKGIELYVEGRAKARAWAGQDGQLRASLDISAWKLEILGAIGRQRPRQARDGRSETRVPGTRRREDGPQRRMPAFAGAVGNGRRMLDDDEIYPDAS